MYSTEHSAYARPLAAAPEACPFTGVATVTRRAVVVVVLNLVAASAHAASTIPAL